MERDYLIVISAIAMIGIIVSALAANPLIASITIPASGVIGIGVQARSGSVEDIQAAVDQATETGTPLVKIPEGNWTFAAVGSYRVNINVPSTGLRITGAGIDQTILRLPADESVMYTQMFCVNGESGGRIDISGITFWGRPHYATSLTGDIGIWIQSCQDFRIHHCSFHDLGSAGVWVNDKDTLRGTGGDISKVSQGLVDHCGFYRMYKPSCYWQGIAYGYGVSIARGDAYYDTPWDSNIWNILGRYYKNVYIEDCYFDTCRHAGQSNHGGVYVFRYNNIVNPPYTRDAMMTGHPARMYALPVWGMRAWEIYNNTFDLTGEGYSAILVAGGGGVIYNNAITDSDPSDFDRFAEIQTSWTDDPNVAIEGSPHDLWIWSNSLAGIEEPFAAFSRHANLPAPVEWDGVGDEPLIWYSTQEPWGGTYTPYTYPHPLTLE